MSRHLQSALARRERIWPAVVFSLALHGVAIGWGLAKGSRAEIDLEQKPIVAKLVRLGEQRPKELLPRKETAPPPPAAPEAPVAPVPVPAAPAAPGPAPVVTKAPAPKAPPRPAADARAARTNTLSNVLSRVQREASAEEERRWGSPDGDPLGDSDEGEGDRYLALVKRALDDNWAAPSITERESLHLTASIILYIEPDGRITRYSFDRRSGNAAFDAALERTVRSTRVPPPPPEMRDTYRSRGIKLVYRPS